MRYAAMLILVLLAASTANTKDQSFAVRPFDSNQQLDDFHISWYSKHLAAMEEPSLWRTPPGTEIYRVLWLRTFDAPMVFRLTIKSDRSSELITKRTNGQGGYEPGRVVSDQTTPIDKDETQILLATLMRLKFWGAPTNETGPRGFDGAQWVIESVKNGKYHVITRWGGGEFKGWALLLMRKSGEDLQPIY
jgi:hypothetical protein